ncbi:hypothetical protein AB9P05_21170 [Roseivirga sp. BDSF3-8]|uniref:hypothetical protein n=1 Tax=Roseivirga sp. BDSF3-8 TaxID=3241598 RepID=UPI0035319679
MIPEKLKQLFEVIGAVSNITSIYINIKSIKSPFPVSSVEQALSQSQTIEKILHVSFIRKQVAWQKPDLEITDWCKNSLIDLRNNCDMESDNLLNKSVSTNDHFHFLGSLLRSYGSYADEAYKDLVNSDRSNKSLEQVLKKFRKNSYPIIITLIFSLKDGNTNKSESLKKLEVGLKNSNLKMQQVIPKWNVSSTN